MHLPFCVNKIGRKELTTPGSWVLQVELLVNAKVVHWSGDVLNNLSCSTCLSCNCFPDFRILTTVQLPWKTFFQVPVKVNMHLPINPAMPLSVIYQRDENVYPHRNLQMNFHSNFFKITTDLKQPQNSLMCEEKAKL